jgi:hypothetical protein
MVASANKAVDERESEIHRRNAGQWSKKKTRKTAKMAQARQRINWKLHP